MPLTFLAHQAPLLPFARRSSRIDGITLMAGTVAPDLAYVADGTRLQFWAHNVGGIVLWGVPVSILVAVVLVRVVVPVVPDHMPDLGSFRLREYRGLATHRFRLVPAVLGALVGATSHVFIDSFTHGWGWLAENWTWYRSELPIRLPGEPPTPYGIVQYGGHVGLSALCLWGLWRLGRQGWLHERSEIVPRFVVSRQSIALVLGGAVVGAGFAVVWEMTRVSSLSSAIIRMAVSTAAGLSAGAWLASRLASATHDSSLPLADDVSSGP